MKQEQRNVLRKLAYETIRQVTKKYEGKNVTPALARQIRDEVSDALERLGADRSLRLVVLQHKTDKVRLFLTSWTDWQVLILDPNNPWVLLA